MKLDIYNNKDVSDIPLIGNPQITYFKSVYRKHTPFFVERVVQEGVKSGNNFNYINPMADLIKSVDLEINVTNNTTTIPPSNIGTTLIGSNSIKLHAGQQIIEDLTGDYIEMYMKLKNPRGVNTYYCLSGSELICKQGTMEQMLSLSGGVFQPSASITSSNINMVLPIPFSFCRDMGHAFPLLLLESNNLHISFNTDESILNASYSYNFIINYIFLTDFEKMRFTSSNNKYLYEVIKENSINVAGRNIHMLSLNYIGNIKSIIWKTTNKDYKYNIQINNGYNLFNKNKSYHYFTRKTISDSGFLGGGTSETESGSTVIHDDTIAYYSFALKDYDINDPLAPSGSISSNANKIRLIIENNEGFSENIKVYTKSYNILDISTNKIKLEYLN